MNFKNYIMKNLSLIISIILVTSLYAQNENETPFYMNSIVENPFTTTEALDKRLTFEEKASLKYALGHNPVQTGENVHIISSEEGDVISVFEPTGAFVTELIVDSESSISTLNLESGEYYLKSNFLHLNLLVL